MDIPRRNPSRGRIVPSERLAINQKQTLLGNTGYGRETTGNRRSESRGLEKSECIERSHWGEYTKYEGALSMRKKLDKTLSPTNARKISGPLKKFFDSTQNAF